MIDFDFTPTEGLLNVNAYPTEPTTETEARQQFMSLFNQIKDYLNLLKDSSFPANGGNADTLGGHSSSYFANATHSHTWSAITGKPTNIVYNNTPRFAWTGQIPNNTVYTLTHGLNSANVLVTVGTTIGNVNPTWGYKDNNSLNLYNFSSNECTFAVKIW